MSRQPKYSGLSPNDHPFSPYPAQPGSLSSTEARPSSSANPKRPEPLYRTDFLRSLSLQEGKTAPSLKTNIGGTQSGHRAREQAHPFPLPSDLPLPRPFPLPPPRTQAFSSTPPKPPATSRRFPTEQQSRSDRASLAPPRSPYPTPPLSDSPSPLPTKTNVPYPALTAFTPACPFSPGDLCDSHYFPPKGFGLIATKPIPRGTTIIVEPPLIVCSLEPTADEMRVIFNALPESGRIQYLSFRPKGGDDDLFVDIAETNGIPMPSGGTGCQSGEFGGRNGSGKMGVFAWISMVNHSCVPNTVWRWDSAQRVLVLSSWRDITKGEEITAPYIDSLVVPYAERHAEILESFFFACLCPACSVPKGIRAASDRALRQYHALKARWTPRRAEGENESQEIDKDDLSDYFVWASDMRRARADLAAAAKILEEQQKWDELGEVYDAAFHLSCISGNGPDARAAAKRAREHYAISMGRKEAGRTWDQWTTKVEEHRLWNVLAKQMEAEEASLGTRLARPVMF